MRKSLAAFALSVVLLPSTALAQSVPVSFTARVTSNTNGTDAAVFTVGSPISISYVVNTAAADIEADPQRGVFSGAVQNLSVSFPTLGVFAEGTSGGAQTFDNFPDGTISSDQVFLFGGALASSSNLGGTRITDAEIDYVSAFLPLPEEPLMITGDAVPTVVPPFFQGFVILSTANGPTFVHFEVTGEGTLLRLTANGSDGPLTITRGDALSVALQLDVPGNGLADATVALGVVTPTAVVWLGPNGFTNTPAGAYTGPFPDFAATVFDFPSTAAFPTGTYTFFVLVRDNTTGVVRADTVQVTVL